MNYHRNLFLKTASLVKYAGDDSSQPIERDQGLDWMWGAFGNPLYNMTQRLASSGYEKAVAPLSRAPLNAAYDNARTALGQEAKKLNVDVSEIFMDPMHSRYVPYNVKSWELPESLSKYKTPKTILNLFKLVAEMTGLDNRGVQIAPQATPGIIAHELGHALQHRAWWPIRTAANIAAGYTSLPILFSDDENKARRAANVTTGLGAVTLANELEASIRGARMMAKNKIPGRFKAFLGIPTYLLTALMPQIAYKTKKHFGGYSKGLNTGPETRGFSVS